MYTLFSPRPAVWPTTPAPNSQQVYFQALPGTPLMMNAPKTDSLGGQMMPQPVCYQMQPGWYPSTQPSLPSRSRNQSEDVFLPDGLYMYNGTVYNASLTTPGPLSVSCYDDVFVQPETDTKAHEGLSFEPSLESNPASSSGSPRSSNSNSSYESSPERCYKPKKLFGHPNSTNVSSNSSDVSCNSNFSGNSSNPPQDDSVFQNLFPSSLCVALNEDPPEPPSSEAPLKTSSPIQNQNVTLQQPVIDISSLQRRGRIITSSSSERCPRFSENGLSDDLDQCDKILIQNRVFNPAEEMAKKREEFLLVLEAERERQRRMVLPKHAPKMNCKFCKNNGEGPEVYTKHRLHYNEKTVCPLLRHYVCRLCNSTGDFAHTIRHCPFNDRKDKIAWKATFLV